jgi:hypothetical protein
MKDNPMKLSKHAKQERSQQRAIPAIIFDFAVYAEEVRASEHAQRLHFSRKSLKLMRAEGVCKKDIIEFEKKKHLRLIVKDNLVTTGFYAHQGKKRIQHYEH